MIAESLDPPAVFRKQRRIKFWGILFAIAGLVALPIMSHQVIGYRTFLMPSGSMEPSLRGPGVNGEDPDKFRVEWLLSRGRSPGRGEIWVFRAPPEASPNESEFVKRVIGRPGETVEVVPSRLLADGKVAFTLSQESGGISMDQQQWNAARAEQDSAALPMDLGEPLIVIAVGEMPHWSADQYVVKVAGKKVLEDASGYIESRTLDQFGGEMEGRLFMVNGEPRLAMVFGKVLALEKGHVRINGRPIQEPYVMESAAYAYGPKKLGDDEYFMMGDNRNNSNDSHAWGPLKRDRFIGHAQYRIWPPHRAGGM